MRVVKDINEIHQYVKDVRRSGQSLALIPTMGFLHQGHLSLVKEARARADVVAVSIFLNPTQFNDTSDFDKYPRDLDGDLKLLSQEDTNLVFCPSVSDIYRNNPDTWVSIDHLSRIHEGEFRPGHFRGVTTVVNILFNIFAPDLAFFGEKDFQQLGLIKKMAADLHMPIEIVGCKTIREQDGLALSSRNARLTKSGREKAPLIYQGLKSGLELFKGAERSSVKIEKEISNCILKEPSIKIEYVRVIDPKSFERRKETALIGDRIIVAAWIDGVRLIDNIGLE